MFKKGLVKFIAQLLSIGVLFTIPINLSPISASTEEQADALFNGGFEESVVNGSIPGWNDYPSPMPTDRDVRVTDEIKFTGNYSLLIEDNSGGSVGCISDKIAVEPGKTYTASCYAYLGAGEAPAARIYIKFFDAASKEIGSQSVGISTPKGQWRKLTIDGIAPAEAISSEIWLYSGGANKGIVYFDDVTFEEKVVLELPFEYGNPIDLGPATLIAKTQGITIDNGEVYIGTNGSPSVFYALDAQTGEVKFSQPIPNIDVMWAITVGADGNVYFAGTHDGIVYRYLPQEMRVEKVGANPSNKWVWQLDATQDGKIYGSTYPDAKAFEYDIETNTFKDLGVIYEGQEYVRGAGVTDEYLYFGIGAFGHLMRMDRETGEMVEIPLPITGTNTMVNNVWIYRGKLFVAYGTSLAILDEETGELLKEMKWQDTNTYDGIISPPSPYNPNLIYFRNKNTSELWIYDMDSNEIAVAEPGMEVAKSPLKGIGWVTLTEGEKAGREVLLMISHLLEYVIYDPIERSFTRFSPEIKGQGIDVQSLEAADDGRLYMGGYQGAMSIYNPNIAKFERQERQPEQIEGIGFLNGKVYFGAYGGARIYRYDPDLPYGYEETPEGNPGLFYTIPGQSRPFAFTSGDDHLFVGTISDYGKLGGALAIYDETNDEWSSHTNVVQDQSIIGLAYKNGKLYGGTTIWGGAGVEPTAEQAKMFIWDVENDTKIEEFNPNVPGFKTPKMIGQLSLGPDGLLWGIMWGDINDVVEGFALFAMNRNTKEIVKYRILEVGTKASSWRPFFIRWGEDGLLYTTLGRQLLVFDPDTLDYKQLVNGWVHLMTLGKDGSIYYAVGPNLYKFPVPISSVTISSDDKKMEVGDRKILKVNTVLVNDKQGYLDGATVEYVSSDPTVLSIDEGVMTAHKEGSVEVYVNVTQDGETQKSNILKIKVCYKDKDDKHDE